MNKLILASVVIVPLFSVTGCVTETVYYTPAYSSTHYVRTVGYTTPYVTTVGYASPYWNDSYYYGYDDLGDVGYWGMYDSYNVY